MKILSILLCILLVVGCDKSTPLSISQIPEIITSNDECHLCGMIIYQFSGPKGQAFGHGQAHSAKFCSTIDLLTWALQPENTAKISKMVVHDMTTDHWENPKNNPYIDATKAWYVWGHHRKGAMGATLASFKTKQAAIQFSKIYKGKVYYYTDITLSLLMNKIIEVQL